MSLAFISAAAGGKHSRRTPDELRNLAERNGFQIYLHFPVPLKTYDESISVLQKSLDAARLGDTDKLQGFERLHRFLRTVEDRCRPEAAFDAVVAHEHAISPGLAGRTVLDDKRTHAKQLGLFEEL